MKLESINRSACFDLVYTSNGVWVWLDDLSAHFSGINELLKETGFFIACDVHPSRRPFDYDGNIFKRYDNIEPFENEYNILYHYRTQDVVNGIIDSGMNIIRIAELMDRICGDIAESAVNAFPSRLMIVILNTNKKREKICAEIQYKTVFNSYEIVGLIFSIF